MKKILGLLMIAALLAICTSVSAYEAIPGSKEAALINDGYNVVSSNDKEMPARKTYFKSGLVQTMPIFKRWVQLEKAGGSGSVVSTKSLGGGWTISTASNNKIELVIYYVKIDTKTVNVPVNLDKIIVGTQPVHDDIAKERKH